MAVNFNMNDLKWLWAEWLKDLSWDDPLKELVLHSTWKPNCKCFVCWLEKQQVKHDIDEIRKIFKIEEI